MQPTFSLPRAPNFMEAAFAGLVLGSGNPRAVRMDMLAVIATFAHRKRSRIGAKQNR